MIGVLFLQRGNAMRLQGLAGAFVLALALATTGCHVQVDKDQNGQEKNVRVDTPFGGVHVRSDQTTAADLGLPVYPGAQLTTDSEGDKSADVRLGFGQWQLHVEVVTYTTRDPQTKVIAFYKGAMGRFGDVIACQGNKAEGTPSVTSEGLTCNEDHKQVHVNGVDLNDDDSGFTLRAGSKRHQHIFVLKSSGEGTRYSLVELELPQSDDGSGKGSD